MKKTIGIVDYGVGNLSSVAHAFRSLDYRCRVSSDRQALDECDMIILPGVGAFPTAMSALHACDLAEWVKETARSGRAMLGLCLGMQLLADSSLENGLTAGLGIIPGQVVPLGTGRWHVGWNSIEVPKAQDLLMPSDGKSFYFNHSFFFDAPGEYLLCRSRLDKAFTVGVRRGNVVGLQFHPEKSQDAGRKLLRALVEGLTHA